MNNHGLNKRLSQHSRRAGFAVGLSMALTIALCIGSFSWIYAKVDPFTRDFVDAQDVAATSTPRDDARDEEGNEEESAQEPEDEPTAGSEEEPTEERDEAESEDNGEDPTSTPDEFRITHISNPEIQVNLRPSPSTDNVPVAVLDGATPLQYLDEQQTGDDGGLWLRFRTEDGREGWMREGTFVEAAN